MTNVEEKIDEAVLQWFGYIERMENDRIAKRVYVGECASNRSVGSPRKRWTDTMKGKQGEWCMVGVYDMGL